MNISSNNYLFALLLLIANAVQLNAQKAELIIPKGHTTPIVHLDYHEKQSLLASSQGNNSYTIWNYDAEKEIRQVTLHDQPIAALSFHPVFAQTLSADIKGRIISYEIEKNRKRSDRIIHSAPVSGLIFIQNGEFFMSFSEDSTVKKINYSSFKIIQDVSFNDKIECIAHSSKNNLTLTSLSNGELILFNDRSEKRNLKNDNDLVFRDLIAFPDENSYLGISEKGNIAKIDINSNSVEFVKQLPFKVKKSIKVDSLLFIAGRGEGDLAVLNFYTLNSIKVKTSFALKKHLDPFNISLQTIEANRDSGIVFIPDYDHSIIGFDFKKDKQIRRFTGLTERIKEIDFAPNGYTMAIASNRNGLRLYDLREIIDQRILENSQPSYSVDFSHNGLYMAVSQKDSLIIYNTDYFEPQFKFPLKGIFPNGNTLFLNDNLFIKKDEREGLTVFHTGNNSTDFLKIKGAYEFKTGYTHDYFAVKSGSNKIFIYDIEKLQKKNKIKAEGIIDFDLFEDNIYVISKSGLKRLLKYDSKGKLHSQYNLPDSFNDEKIKVVNNGNHILSWRISVSKSAKNTDYEIRLWDLDSIKITNSFKGLQSAITSVKYDSKRGFVIASSEDGSIKIWPIQKKYRDEMKFPAAIYPLDGKEIVIMLDNGIYDASRAAMENMHYVQGTEYISLDQIKAKYYEPKLLSKIFSYNKQSINPRSPINNFELYPEIKLQHPSMNGGVLGIDLEERGGGLGDVNVFINQKKAIEYGPKDYSINNQIKFTIENHPFLKPNEINEISVKASNKNGDLTSGANTLRYVWNTDAIIEEKKLYALIVGVSDYEGSRLDLNFSSKDASDISNAIKQGAGNYFGPENVHILDLNSDSSTKNLQPSKNNIISALKEFSNRIKPQDVFLFYFAGHGTQGKEEDNNYYLLTEEASYVESKNMDDPDEYAISDKELGELLGEISSLNMIMILDACHSGEMIDKFNQDMGHLSTKEEKALESLISETGLHILAGSESGDLSYETSLYGQGLLTYSLLFGMKGEALREGQYLDINRLFQYASAKVPELANRVGGVQKPVVKVPKSTGRVDIGEYNNLEKSKIQIISPRPILLPSAFQEESYFLDVKNIGLALDDELKNQANKNGSDCIFISSNAFTGSYKLSGRYYETISGVKFTAKVFRDNTLLELIEIEDSNLDNAILKIASTSLEIIEKDFKKRN